MSTTNRANYATYATPPQSVLNVNVSCFRNYDSPNNPVDINLMQWLTSLKYSEKVNQIRSISSKEERKGLKASLPGITPSGTFTRRSTNALIKHSGLIQFDIDGQDNEHVGNMDELGNQIRNIVNVAYCGLSVSGKGWWGLIPIAYPTLHKAHFDALFRDFGDLGIRIDPACSSVANLRGYSIDTASYFNHTAELYTKLYKEPVRRYNAVSKTNEGDKVETCIKRLESGSVDITSSYADWFGLSRALANEFGEGGRDYFHRASAMNPSYSGAKCDRQYDAALRSPGTATIATFYHLCNEHGVNWKNDDYKPGTKKATPPPQKKGVTSSWTRNADGELLDNDGLPVADWWSDDDIKRAPFEVAAIVSAEKERIANDNTHFDNKKRQLSDKQIVASLESGLDGTRTRDLRRDRAAF